MSKLLPWLLGAAAILLLMYYAAPHLVGVVGWLIGCFIDIITWLLGKAWLFLGMMISVVWHFIKSAISITLEWYISIVKAYPLISAISYGVFFGVSRLIGRLFAYKVSSIWLMLLAPICATAIGTILYGGGSLKIDISVTNAGLICAAIVIVSVLYYVLIKAKILTPLVDSRDAVSKMLNYSFIIVITLMIGAFGAAAIDRIVPLLSNHVT